MEKFIRNAILFGLTDVKDFDFLWISDIDEIPNKNKVFKLGRLSMFFSLLQNEFIKKFLLAIFSISSWETYNKDNTRTY